MAGLYIHIPFCKRKCRYCDFVSFASHDDFFPYTAALITEMRLHSPLMSGRTFETVFIGGGTPSLLPEGLIGRILSEARSCFTIAPDAEITIECNPESLTSPKLSDYASAGVNRISIGMQSADDRVLEAIGRIHNKENFIEAFKLALGAGFTNINVDVMHGLPLQTVDSYLDSIRLASDLGAAHISSYALILEEGTQLYEDVSSGRVTLPDDDETADMEDAGFRLLKDLDYERYEISNFAKPGFRCRHNLNYWNNGDYLGLGVNAHSALHANGKWVRFSDKTSLSEYISDTANGRLPIAETEDVPLKEEMFESVMLGLRKIDGVDRAAFEKRFGVDPVLQYAQAVNQAILNGNMTVTDEAMLLTEKGLDFQNEVLIDFM